MTEVVSSFTDRITSGVREIPDVIGDTADHAVKKTQQGLFEYSTKNYNPNVKEALSYEPIDIKPVEPLRQTVTETTTMTNNQVQKPLENTVNSRGIPKYVTQSREPPLPKFTEYVNTDKPYVYKKTDPIDLPNVPRDVVKPSQPYEYYPKYIQPNNLNNTVTQVTKTVDPYVYNEEPKPAYVPPPQQIVQPARNYSYHETIAQEPSSQYSATTTTITKKVSEPIKYNYNYSTTSNVQEPQVLTRKYSYHETPVQSSSYTKTTTTTTRTSRPDLNKRESYSYVYDGPTVTKQTEYVQDEPKMQSYQTITRRQEYAEATKPPSPSYLYKADTVEEIAQPMTEQNFLRVEKYETVKPPEPKVTFREEQIVTNKAEHNFTPDRVVAKATSTASTTTQTDTQLQNAVEKHYKPEAVKEKVVKKSKKPKEKKQRIIEEHVIVQPREEVYVYRRPPRPPSPAITYIPAPPTPPLFYTKEIRLPPASPPPRQTTVYEEVVEILPPPPTPPIYEVNLNEYLEESEAIPTDSYEVQEVDYQPRYRTAASWQRDNSGANDYIVQELPASRKTKKSHHVELLPPPPTPPKPVDLDTRSATYYEDARKKFNQNPTPRAAGDYYHSLYLAPRARPSYASMPKERESLAPPIESKRMTSKRNRLDHLIVVDVPESNYGSDFEKEAVRKSSKAESSKHPWIPYF